MKCKVYLVVSRDGFQQARKSPNFQLAAGERAFCLDIEVDDRVFAPPLLPTVRLTIPAQALMSEVSVEGEIVENPALPEHRP